MATNTPKPIHSLVLDAAEFLYTIPAVIDEIRDPATRSRVETTLKPFIQCRSPRPESVKIITDFARRTGDLEVLSRPDIHLMALAYELECERNHGDWRLRSVPGQKRVNGPPPASLTGGSADPAVTEKEGETVISVETATQNAPAPTASTQAEDDSQAKEIEEKLLETHISTTDAEEAPETAPAVQSPASQEDTPNPTPSKKYRPQRTKTTAKAGSRPRTSNSTNKKTPTAPLNPKKSPKPCK
ncbi:20S-pre-rRNA D-site endonuclease [Lachnellula subtilissima]|uniref:20S-pre-rRNA D-site endonuclease n=1 Tax=Lachnellula subtilissima TaxID=602034 RepID=A0A8H8RKQ0_9HELO|nr:20S-pre-rRNA D-site endonuclease [Lachnellula subtilissima]